jgi:signal transduction histidine kinase
LAQPHILVISDNASFAQSVTARWQMEPHAPVLTQASSDVGEAAAMNGFGLVIVGPVSDGALEPLVGAIEGSSTVLCVCASSQEARSLALAHPATICVPQQDGWLDTLMLLSREIMKRVDADSHALQAERAAAARKRESVLGRSMMEMSHVVTDALTSLLGNAELLLLAPEPFSPQSREQIRTIRTMALRLSEVMQHFSSLATEFSGSEKESQSETCEAGSLRFSGGQGQRGGR